LSTLGAARSLYSVFNKVLGLLALDPGAFFRKKEKIALRQGLPTPEEIRELLDQRSRARSEKNWKEADRIRDELVARGILILDGPQGTTWKIKPGGEI
jgi:cysteinyl-tRNA synthetase